MTKTLNPPARAAAGAATSPKAVPHAFTGRGRTEPSVGEHPWLTRNNPEAERDGWRHFGSGSGFTRLLWNNPHFQGAPRYDGIATPWTWRAGQSGAPQPGALRYVGQWVCPPKLGRGLQFCVCTSRNRESDSTRVVARLFLDGKLVAGHQTAEWAEANGRAGTDPRTWPIAGAEIKWLRFKEKDEQAWAEFITPKLDLADGQRLNLVFEYANWEGPNHLSLKIVSRDLAGDEYFFGEICPQDLCYPDHFEVTPRSLRAGEKALVSWCTTRAPDVRLNGHSVGHSGQFEFTATESRSFEFVAGESRRTIECKIS